MPAHYRADEPTALAPDGAQIRTLVDRENGSSRLSIAEALVAVGQRTMKVYHQTIYEEIWYFLQGTGIMHLQQRSAEDEEVFAIERGASVLIRAGDGFWVENTGQTDLVFLCCGSPPWPGSQEAQLWPPNGGE